MEKYQFIDKEGSFTLAGAENCTGLYFPVAGEHGIKSAITPNLSGDIKLDQNHFIMEPVSAENLHNNRSGRNFWCCMKNGGAWSVVGESAEAEATKFTDVADTSKVTAGLMWHNVERESTKYQLKAEVTSFVPIQRNVEIMQIRITNIGRKQAEFVPIAAIPIFGRSADNIRDHRHVTSLLHRTSVSKYGIRVKPTLSFDERGHQKNDVIYYVEGMSGTGKAPKSFFPEVAEFIGEGGTLEHPRALLGDLQGVTDGYRVDGQEALGGLVFEETVLAPGHSTEYTVFIGACHQLHEISQIHTAYGNSGAVYHELEVTKQYWNNKVNVTYHSGDDDFDQFMHWVSFQPELRRIYGCSFLPHHDYGKGGRGWRDLWQDCLALLMMNPGGVRQMLVSNFAGVRVDGSNATIIGEHQGEFKADRNAITRVWMDHGVWPFMTTKLYIDQTGDTKILYQNVPYFKDRQVMRGTDTDEQWTADSQWQKDERNNQYEGTILEHMLIQNLSAFYEVGEHNEIRLRDADWNDALDMAGHRGESVAFTNAYAENLMGIAELLEREAECGNTQIDLLQEVEALLDDDSTMYDDISHKTELLRNYMDKCRHTVSGIHVKADAKKTALSLRHKAEWMMQHIRDNEWVEDESGHGWFNGYYDDNGRKVEGQTEEGVRMMLTSQVFSIMAGTATEEQIAEIVKSADEYLYDKDCGGYRLNTNFHELKTDMGRMFGFAYGEKENGAVFSHMAVMYANALYKRGFAKEGYKSLHSLYAQAMNFEKSRIYPGIPEYFGKDGRGLYHYLTGAASWYMLTVITQMFGVRGEAGNLVIEPKLLKEQFDKNHLASLELKFAGHSIKVEISNPAEKEYGTYIIAHAQMDEQPLEEIHTGYAVISKEKLQMMDTRKQHKIKLVLQ